MLAESASSNAWPSGFGCGGSFILSWRAAPVRIYHQSTIYLTGRKRSTGGGTTVEVSFDPADGDDGRWRRSTNDRTNYGRRCHPRAHDRPRHVRRDDAPALAAGPRAPRDHGDTRPPGGGLREQRRHRRPAARRGRRLDLEATGLPTRTSRRDGTAVPRPGDGGGVERRGAPGNLLPRTRGGPARDERRLRPLGRRGHDDPPGGPVARRRPGRGHVPHEWHHARALGHARIDRRRRAGP